MAILLKCGACSHEWSVPTAKAGLSVHCPDCDAEVNVPKPKRDSSASGEFERIRSGHRPKTDNNIVGRSVLLGGLVLFVGIGALIALRVTGLMGTENLNFDPEEAIARATDSPSDQPSNGEEPSADSTASDTENNAGSDASTATTTETNSVDTDGLSPSQKREKLLLAMKHLVIDVKPLLEDQRGAVADTVSEAVAGAVQRCGIKPADDAASVMSVELLLQGDDEQRRLTMTATLKENESDGAFIIWEHTDGLGVLNERALSTGVVPARLEQNVASFFSELRQKVVDLRLENQS